MYKNAFRNNKRDFPHRNNLFKSPYFYSIDVKTERFYYIIYRVGLKLECDQFNYLKNATLLKWWTHFDLFFV